MPSITTAYAADALQLRREAAQRAETAALAARLRRRPGGPEADANAAQEARGRAAREAPADEVEYEVLDFRQQDPELRRYRDARDARIAWGRGRTDEAADGETTGYVVEVRVPAPSAGEAAGEVSAAAAAQAAPGAVRNTEAATRAYAALAEAPGGETAAAVAAQDAAEYQAMREATLRTQAANAYRAAERLPESRRLNVVA